MNMLQGAAVADATAFLVLAFCTGIKAAWVAHSPPCWRSRGMYGSDTLSSAVPILTPAGRYWRGLKRS